MSVPQRARVPRDVLACLKLSLLPRNCKDMDLLLALQLATSEGNNVGHHVNHLTK